MSLGKVALRGIRPLPGGWKVRVRQLLEEDAGPLAQHRRGTLSMIGALQHLRHNGFLPASIVDVGAFDGQWSEDASAIFPDASFILVEGNPQNEPSLARVRSRLHPQLRYHIAVVGAAPVAEVPYYTHGTGSSVLRELTTFEQPLQYRPMTTLDALTTEIEGPVLVKLDIQGYELEALKGAAQLLSKIEVAILEVSLLPYNDGAPLFAEVIAFMADRGFAVYDFCGQFRRHTDGAVFQQDVMFVRVDSRLREAKRFWAKEP